MTNKAYKYRIYPTKTQKQWLMKTFGCCRFVYNQALHWRTQAYRVGGISMTYCDTSYGLTKTKKVYPWLNDADSASLQQSLRHLDTAFKAFFDGRSRYPRPKKRGVSRYSYTTPMNGKAIKVGTKNITLPKVGRIKAVIHRPIPDGCRILSATVSMEKDGTFYVSICVEYNACVVPRPVESVVGLDYKSDGLARTSDGDEFGSLQSYRRMEKRIKRAHRDLSRKAKLSCNREKARIRLAKLYRKVSNQRYDYLHQWSNRIANRYDLVCVEDLDLVSMSSSDGRYHLGKSTLDNGYGMFVSMLEYKLADRGGYIQKVERFFASSQTCSCCGHKNPLVKDLRIRAWVCPVCWTMHDRDDNASEVVKIEGIRLFNNEHPHVIRPERSESAS